MAAVVDLLDIRRDRPLDEDLRVGVLDIGVAHPQVLPALLGDAGDRANRQPGHIRRACESERDLPVLIAALRTGCAEEQALAGSKPLESSVVHFARQKEQGRLVAGCHGAGRDEVRLGKVVHWHGDVHAIDAIVGDADRALEIRRDNARWRVDAHGRSTVRDVLRAAAGVEGEGRLARLRRRRFGAAVAHRALPDVVGQRLDLDRLPGQAVVLLGRLVGEFRLRREIVVRAENDVLQFDRGILPGN